MKKEMLFEYENYRIFLSDYLLEQKKIRDTYSARYFSQVAGFSSPNYCSQIINGNRNITLKSLPKVLKALKFKGKYADYFEALVGFTQTDKIEEKENYFNVMTKIRKNSGSKKVNENQCTFFSKWYYAVIREVACMVNWKDDYALLGSLITPKIPKQEVIDCIDFLRTNRMIQKNSNGSYSMIDEYITDVDVPVFIRAKARKEILNLGIEACEKLSNKNRYTTISTYQLSKSAYSEVVAIIEQSREKIGEIVRSDSGNKKVYELIHQLFPVTEELKKEN